MSDSVTLLAPLSGRLLPLPAVPDPVFAQGMVGQGFAVEASEGRLVAPVAGRVLQVFPGGHAVVLGGPRGLELILHIGLDTVELRGRGFQPACCDGQEVAAGETLVAFDCAEIAKTGRSLISPCVIANSDLVADVVLAGGERVKAGSDIAATVILK